MAISDIDPSDAKLIAQAKAAAAAKAAATPKAPTVTKPIAADPANQAMLDKALALLDKSKANLASLEAANVAAGLNADGSKKTATQVLQEKKAATAADRAALEAKDPLFNKAAGAPAGAPAGYHYTWIGGTSTGQWQLYPNATGGGVTGGGTGGGEDITVKPGSSGAAKGDERTLAVNTFKNTLALFFGAQEMSKSWVDALYSSVSNFYNSGSTIDESLNLSLQDVRNNPGLKPFTDRFSGIYALQDRLAKGEAIEVPTIAEYFKSESTMGDVLREAGMGDLATQSFLGTVLGLGKSVLEVTNLINDTFKSIDNAPEALKKDLQTYFPGVSRTDIAKALLTGKEGAAELNKKIEGISTLSAAKSQGVTVDLATAGDIAARGYDYNKSLTGFADVKRLERGQMLGQMSGIDFTQNEAIASTFKSDVTAQEKMRKIAEEEANRFASRSGRLASQNRASQQV